MKASSTIACWLLLSCGNESLENADALRMQADNFETDECEVCGMILREQPAPRGQAVHRDGTRRYFCSIGDMVTYQQAPSPHGDLVARYVETLDSNVSPSEVSTEQRSWRDVREVTFVLGGLERPVMGEPVLTFASPSEGTAAAERLGARAVSWDAVMATMTALTSERENQ